MKNENRLVLIIMLALILWISFTFIRFIAYPFDSSDESQGYFFKEKSNG